MGLAEIRKLKGVDHLYPNEKAAVKSFKVKVPDAPRPIPKKSDTQKFIDGELKKAYPIFLRLHPRCEIQGPDCNGKATCAHHTEGRLPSKVLDQSKWVPSCGPCNTWVEVHHAQAAKRGLKKSKF